MEFSWSGLSLGFQEIRQRESAWTGKKKSEQDDPKLEHMRCAIESLTAADRRSDRDGHREQHERARRSEKDPGDQTKTAAKLGDGGGESPELRHERNADEPVEGAAESFPESNTCAQLRETVHDDKRQAKADPQDQQPAIESILKTPFHVGE
jgi:hypothetical protein